MAVSGGEMINSNAFNCRQQHADASVVRVSTGICSYWEKGREGYLQM